MNTVAAILVERLLEAAQAEGVPRERLLTAAELPAPFDREGRVPERTYFALWDAALVLASPYVHLSLRVGTWLRPDDYGALGLAFKTAANLREAIDLAVQYLHALTDAAHLEVDEADAMVRLRLRRTERAADAIAAANEATLIEIVHAMRNISSHDIGLRAVSFAHRQSRHRDGVADFFRCPVTFSAAADEVTFDAPSLQTALPKADGGLSAFLVQHLEKTVAPRANGAWMPRLRTALAEALPSGRATIEEMAQVLGTSTRSLQRRLQEHGFTFQALLAEVRQDLAVRLLTTTQLHLGEVTFLLGFSEPAAFSRAFRRWTGSAPSEYRARSRG